MGKRNESRPLMKWDVMDVMNMSYQDELFDIIIDKSTFDCLNCGESAQTNLACMLKECQRVLKTGGKYVAFCFNQPISHELHFKRDNLGFDLKTYTIEKFKGLQIDNAEIANLPKLEHYVYVCTKRADANERHSLHYERVLNEITQGKLYET